MIHAPRRPDLPVLVVVAGWMVLGLAIMASDVLPFVASPVLDVEGWAWLATATGFALAVGGVLGLLSASGRKDSTRWWQEQSACLLLASGWASYGVIAMAGGSWGVFVLAVAHSGACLTRLAQGRREEIIGRELDGRRES